jgi:hypothetical protein
VVTTAITVPVIETGTLAITTVLVTVTYTITVPVTVPAPAPAPVAPPAPAEAGTAIATPIATLPKPRGLPGLEGIPIVRREEKKPELEKEVLVI